MTVKRGIMGIKGQRDNDLIQNGFLDVESSGVKSGAGLWL